MLCLLLPLLVFVSELVVLSVVVRAGHDVADAQGGDDDGSSGEMHRE
jgi:hypothetical protein